MKKILFAVLIAALIGISNNNANAQCSGANVLITNVQFNQTQTHYVYQFNWTFIQGNASIQIRFRCGTNYTYNGRCFPALKDSALGPHFVKDSVAIVDIPNCPAPAAKLLVIGVWTSNQCNGNFCELGFNLPVPVTFASFNANRNNANVNLRWTTAMEQNCAGFYVERNSNGNWEQVGYVASQSIGGNSDALLSYSYTDLNTVKGISQYRIREVDYDAKATYSLIRSVKGEGQLGATIVYPNPSNNGKVNIVFEDASVTREINVIDMSGRSVRQIKGITNNNITIENLNPGMYSVRIIAVETGEQAVEKIIVNKR